MEQLSRHIESLIFTAQGPITFGEIKEALEESFDEKFKKKDIESALQKILDKYKDEAYSFEIVEIAKGYQFFTKGTYHGTVGSRLKLISKKRLSKAALETLAIIAYKQPIIKSEVEKIRGVSCDYTVQKLLEKELIAISGRAETPGRPLLYSTSQKFMDYFGLKDISELPKPKDFHMPDQEIGEAAPIEELSEEQRLEKTIALEEISEEVAAAILDEDLDTIADALAESQDEAHQNIDEDSTIDDDNTHTPLAENVEAPQDLEEEDAEGDTEDEDTIVAEIEEDLAEILENEEKAITQEEQTTPTEDDQPQEQQNNEKVVDDVAALIKALPEWEENPLKKIESSPEKESAMMEDKTVLVSPNSEELIHDEEVKKKR